MFATDLVVSSTRHLVSNIILITWDSDMIPAIQIAKNEGVIIELFYTKGTAHEDLLKTVDIATPIDRDWIDKVKRTQLGVGCTVKIDNKKVEYVDNAMAESKDTVDLGGWNFSKQSGIFAEVKVSPNVFGNKDCKFLQCLRDTLKLYDFVRYKIYVFSLKQKNLMRERIEALGYSLDSDTIILAPDNLFTEKFFVF